MVVATCHTDHWLGYPDQSGCQLLINIQTQLAFTIAAPCIEFPILYKEKESRDNVIEISICSSATAYKKLTQKIITPRDKIHMCKLNGVSAFTGPHLTQQNETYQ